MFNYHMIVEIPKGDTRRRHFKYDKSGFIDLGSLIETIPLNDGIMPIDYGFIPNTSKTHEGDDVDVLLFSDSILEVGQDILIKPLVLMKRDDKDDKVIAIDQTNKYSSWEEVPQNEKDLILKYFGYHHKIIEIGSDKDAINYIEYSKLVE